MPSLLEPSYCNWIDVCVGGGAVVVFVVAVVVGSWVQRRWYCFVR